MKNVEVAIELGRLTERFEKHQHSNSEGHERIWEAINNLAERLRFLEITKEGCEDESQRG